MSKVIVTTVYQLDELSDAAREKARAWYREGSFDYDWFDAVYEYFQHICDILGVRLKTRAVRLYGGHTRQEPCIWFRGFWSQGDGACFEAYYAWQPQASRQIRDYAPQDAGLHRIADALQAIQRRNFWQLHAEIRHRGNYYHEYCMVIAVGRDCATGQAMTVDAETSVSEALRELARWLYRRLEDEYACLTSDDAVDEAIAANEYTFTESGHRFG